LSKEQRRLKAIYAKSRREFSAADLQKYTVIEKGVPFEEVLEDLEATHQEFVSKKKRTATGDNGALVHKEKLMAKRKTEQTSEAASK
jgi:hypothetical protein